MVIPIIAATSRDLIRGVPLLPREGAVALGMSDWAGRPAGDPALGRRGPRSAPRCSASAGRSARRSPSPWSAGSRSAQLPTNLYAAMITIAANIVQNLDTAITDPMDVSAFAELALMLMVITLATNVIARLMVRRVSGTALPVGRGL